MLDLAFVLLIIFVITTPLLTQSLELKLPTGGAADKTQLQKRDIRTIEISPTGYYRYEGRTATIDQIEQDLAKTFRDNPKLVVHIPADENVPFKYIAAVLERCRRHNIKQVAFRMEPERHR